MERGPRLYDARRSWFRRRAAALGIRGATVVVAGALLGSTACQSGPVPRSSEPGSSSAAEADSRRLDEPAPELSGSTLAGGTLDLADLRGSVVLVHAWAAWCAPCRNELPVLVAAGRRLGERGLRLVGIDTRDGERQARDLLAAVGGDPAFSVVDPDGGHAARWGVSAVPQAFVVNPDGRIVARLLGSVTEEWIEATVVPLLRPARD